MSPSARPTPATTSIDHHRARPSQPPDPFSAIRRNSEKSRNVEAEHAAIVHATLKRDADAAVAALSKHLMTTMQLVELATPKTLGGGDAA